MTAKEILTRRAAIEAAKKVLEGSAPKDAADLGEPSCYPFARLEGDRIVISGTRDHVSLTEAQAVRLRDVLLEWFPK